MVYSDSGLELASSAGLHFLGRKVDVGTRLLQNNYVDIGESIMMSMIFVELVTRIVRQNLSNGASNEGRHRRK